MSFTTPTVDVYLAGSTLSIGNINASIINIAQKGTTINVSGLMNTSNISSVNASIGTLYVTNVNGLPYGNVSTNMSFVNLSVTGNFSMQTTAIMNVSNASFTNVSFVTLLNASTRITSTLLNASNASFINISSSIGTFTTSIYSAGFYSTSDYKLKENIEYITQSQYDIQQLKPCTFNFINSSTKKIGFIAQDVEKFMPESVISSGGTLNIDYSALLSVCVLSMKEMNKKINELNNKIEKIEKFLNIE